MLWFYLILFLLCCVSLYFSGEWVVEGLMAVARYLHWREFVVAFIIMSFASSLPNLFVGISSALHEIPQLSFGEIMGGNVIDLTLAVALAVFLSKGKTIAAESRMVQTTSIFTLIAAILPILLILDGKLTAGDGVVLIFIFFFYLYWLFSKKERFSKVYDTFKLTSFKDFISFSKYILKILVGVIMLLFAAEGIIKSASFFAKNFNLPIEFIGILIVSLGNALPEIYFALASARKGETWMILGNLMGSVVVPATFVLGVVSIIHPIKIINFSIFIIARFFLVISALFFLFFIRSDRKITEKEASFLLGIYIIFIIAELVFR